tara:strand:+ start:1021 stop:1212 length:192 start_codon:yes stop_codon:yes gene_type:complete
MQTQKVKIIKEGHPMYKKKGFVWGYVPKIIGVERATWSETVAIVNIDNKLYEFSVDDIEIPLF